MKVTLGNNRCMVVISVINIVILLILTLMRINEVALDAITWNGLQIIDEITYLAMLWYVISILQFAGETVSIQTPFSILLGLELINFLISYTRLQNSLIISMGVLIGIIFIYSAVNAFRLKNQAFNGTFRLSGIAFLISVVLKFSLAFMPMDFRRSMSLPGPGTFIGFIDMIPLLAILYLIIQTGKILKEATGQLDNGNSVVDNP